MIPVYLNEISPVAFRAVFPGVMYQLVSILFFSIIPHDQRANPLLFCAPQGNMVSSASAQIESTAGATLKTSAGLPDHGKVSIILIAVARPPSFSAPSSTTSSNCF